MQGTDIVCHAQMREGQRAKATTEITAKINYGAGLNHRCRYTMQYNNRKLHITISRGPLQPPKATPNNPVNKLTVTNEVQ